MVMRSHVGVVTKRSNMLTVIAAAVLQGNKIYTMPPPKRHCHIIHAMSRTEGLERVTQKMQGFRLSDGTFATREEAMVVARVAGQIVREPRLEDKLLSEDVW